MKTLLIAFALMGCASAAEKPNILFILVDDMPWFGTPVEQKAGYSPSKMAFRRMPNVETIAQRGMTFSNAYAAAGMCAPSRCSIQTGMSPARHRFSGNGNFGDSCPAKVTYTPKKKDAKRLLLTPSPLGTLNPKFPTIAKVLKKQGYATGHFGKWHVYGGGPEACGYDASDGETSNNEGKSPDPKDPKRIFSTTRHALSFIERSHKAKRPFFVQVSHYANHNQPQSLPKTLAKCKADPAFKKLDSKTIARSAMAADLDTGIGMLLKKLEALGIREKTYIVFTSDNGYDVYNDKRILRGAKWWLWECGVRVPFMVEGPGIKAGSRCGMNIIGYDLLPTFYAMVGGDVGTLQDIDGKNLLPLFRKQRNTAVFADRPLFFHYPHLRNSTPSSAIIQGEYKLYIFYEIPDQPYLFDLTKDLGEETNLAPKMPERANEMRKALSSYFTSVKAYLPKPNPNADTSLAPFDPDKEMPPASKTRIKKKKDKKKGGRKKRDKKKRESGRGAGVG